MEFCQFLKIFLTLVFVIASVQLAQADLRHVIQSPQITNWGKWGEIDRCPEGYFVTGMQLKVEATEGWKDDTGLNGIKFLCSKIGDHSDFDDSFTEFISSSIGDYGQWKKIFKCDEHHNLNKWTTAVVGFQLRSEESKGGAQDDTSANNLRVFCLDFSEKSDTAGSLEVEGDGTNWGQWTEAQFCREGYAICGIVTQIDEGRGKRYDDTSLNNLNAECCEVKLTSSSSELDSFETVSIDHSFPGPVESAIHLHNVLQNLTTHPEAETSQSTESANSHQSVEGLSSEPRDKLSIDLKSSFNGSTTENYIIVPIMPNHTFSDEIKRIGDIDFDTPIVTTTVTLVPTQNTRFDKNETMSQDNFEPVDPIISPEVIRFLNSEGNQRVENVNDQDPLQLEVIAGNINHSADESTTSEMIPDSDMTKDNQDQLLSSSSQGKSCRISMLSFFLIVFCVARLY